MFLRKIFSGVDWVVLSLLLSILILGLVTIYSASVSLGYGAYYFNRQIIWHAVGLFLMLGISFINYKFLCRIAIFVHIFIILLLIFTLIKGTGSRISDAKRWIVILGFTLQPSEMIKFSMILVMAWHFRYNRQFSKFDILNSLWLLAIMVTPFVLIVRQPDLGTAMLFIITFTILVYFSGISYRLIAIVMVIALISMPVVWEYGLADYQKDRILTLIEPNTDTRGKSYHINQSVIAIGSGGLLGKGYLEGTQAQLNFLPARHTDFIFSLFAEEWGFLGAVSLLFLYSALIWRLLSKIGIYKTATENIIIIGVVSVIAIQLIVNVSMVMGLLPVVGVPLPLFSYGGSSSISTLIGLGFVLSIDRHQRI